MSAHLPDVEFGLESMRRVDVQSKGAINDGRPGRSGCRTAPPAPSAATRVTRLRGPKWPSFGALRRVTRVAAGGAGGGRAAAAAVGAAIIDGPLGLDVDTAPRLEAELDIWKVRAHAPL